MSEYQGEYFDIFKLWEVLTSQEVLHRRKKSNSFEADRFGDDK